MNGAFGTLRNMIRAGLKPWNERFRRGGQERRLRLRETLPLGEQRFLAIVEFHGRDLLIAGTANSITLLESADRTRQAIDAAPPWPEPSAPEFEGQCDHSKWPKRC